MQFSFLTRLSIAKKIALGSAIVILLATVSGVYSLITLKSSRVVDNRVTEGYYPLISLLKDFDEIIRNTNYLSTNWMYLPNPQQKDELVAIKEEAYPELKGKLKDFISNWPDVGIDSLQGYLDKYDETIPDQEKLMKELNTSEAYADEFLLFELIPLLDEDIVKPLEELHRSILDEIRRQEEESGILIAEKYNSFDSVELVIIVMTILAVVVGGLTTYFSTISIVKPISQVNHLVQDLSLGKLPDVGIQESRDEIGEMVKSIKKLREGLWNTSDFANQIGRGNLQSDYQPLSDEDVLGYSLITMRDNLRRVIRETNDAVKEAGELGNLSTRISQENKEGAWLNLTGSINSLLDSIAQPFGKVNTVVNAMAGGDLSQRFDDVVNGDLLLMATNLNKALDNVSDLLNQISASSKIVDESSNEMLVVSEEMKVNTQEIASSIAQMSSGAQKQVVKVDESSNLVEAIMNSSRDMGEQADNINLAAQGGVTSSEKGLDLIKKVGHSMEDIATFSANSYDSIQVLTRRSIEISKVLGVITDIASQTNLLALNAAIEAAQAGDAGRGFAVVAEEIRSLAENSKESAKQIERLVHDVQSDVETTSKVMERMKESVKNGEEATVAASAAFSEITESSSKTLVMSEEIRKRVKQQIDDIRNVVTITESVVVIAEQTAAGTEEIASSASELSSGMNSYVMKSERLTEIAEELSSWVSKFKLKV